MQSFIEFIPILTTLFATYFTVEIFKHYQERKTKYLWWWAFGVLTFGLGTLAESINFLFGWNEINFRYWYIVGALLGGFPLAQGSVYLLMSRKFATVTSWIFVSLIVVASVCVILSPLTLPPDFDGKLSGKIFSWEWVRTFSPFINIYAFYFLVGGAIWSALKYYKQKNQQAAFKGNIFIAIGGLLPGIGGTFTRMGYVEVLFITELIGLLLIYVGYRIIKTDRRVEISSSAD
jgi:hypothetical protein